MQFMGACSNVCGPAGIGVHMDIKGCTRQVVYGHAGRLSLPLPSKLDYSVHSRHADAQRSPMSEQTAHAQWTPDGCTINATDQRRNLHWIGNK